MKPKVIESLFTRLYSQGLPTDSVGGFQDAHPEASSVHREGRLETAEASANQPGRTACMSAAIVPCVDLRTRMKLERRCTQLGLYRDEHAHLGIASKLILICSRTYRLISLSSCMALLPCFPHDSLTLPSSSSSDEIAAVGQQSERFPRNRAGSLTCHQRKKKCDGSKPQCKACERNELDCSWPPYIQRRLGLGREQKTHDDGHCRALAVTKKRVFDYFSGRRSLPHVYPTITRTT